MLSATETVKDVMNKVALLSRSLPELSYSMHTSAWYVNSPIEITDGSVISGITEHRATPEAACRAYWDFLTSIKLGDKKMLRIPRGYNLLGAQYSESAGMFVFFTQAEMIDALTKDSTV